MKSDHIALLFSFKFLCDIYQEKKVGCAVIHGTAVDTPVSVTEDIKCQSTDAVLVYIAACIILLLVLTTHDTGSFRLCSAQAGGMHQLLQDRVCL